MDSDADMMARHIRLLARFAEQAASLAEDLCASALAAETLEEKQAASLAFHRMGRALRQTIALEARLRRDESRALREDRDEGVKLEAARVEKRKAHVKGTVERLIWTETEDADDAEDLVDRLESLVEAEAGVEGFAAEAPEAQIVRLCEILGLDPPEPSSAHPRAGGDPSGGSSDQADDEDPDDYWRSSA
jgi:hypothetical protein